MAKVKFYIDSKDSKNSPIFLRFKHLCKEFKYYLGEKIAHEKWDATKQRVKGASREAVLLNDKMAEVRALLERIARSNKEASAQSIKEIFLSELNGVDETKTHGKQPPSISITFTSLFDKFLEARKNTLSYNSKKTYKRIKLFIVQFGDVDICEISKKYFEKLHSWLIEEKKFLNATIQGDFKKIKALLRYFVEDEPFLQKSDCFKFKTPSTEEMFRQVVSEEEILKLLAFEFKDIVIQDVARGNRIEKSEKKVKAKTLEKMRDAFCFSFFTGLRYSDFSELQKTEIKETVIEAQTYKYIDFVSKKTKKVSQIPLSSEAIRIIEKYEGKFGKVFPYVTNQALNKFLHLALRESGLFNTEIKEVKYSGSNRVEKVLKRYEALTFHCARHSFATHLVNMSLPITYIQELLGHSDLKTTLKYAKNNKQKIMQETLKAFRK